MFSIIRADAPKIQFTNGNNDATSSFPIRSHFVKKSALQTMGKDFKFNFPVVSQLTQLDLNESSATEKDDANVHTKTDTETTTSTASTVPDSSFRFNFNVEVEENGFAKK